MNEKPPACRYCGRPLLEGFGARQKAKNAVGGDYGDGVFCGLRCGYRWAVNASPAAVITYSKGRP